MTGAKGIGAVVAVARGGARGEGLVSLADLELTDGRSIESEPVLGGEGAAGEERRDGEETRMHCGETEGVCFEEESYEAKANVKDDELSSVQTVKSGRISRYPTKE